MSIDWIHFSPWAALAGGMLIGLAATVLLLVAGRIAGISGIVGGLLQRAAGDAPWRLAFIAGLLAAPAVYGVFSSLPATEIDASYGALAAAGLLVGLGARYGAGCTSGHGVCGLSRLSPRSAVATLVFMAAGFGTVFVIRHVLAA